MAEPALDAPREHRLEIRFTGSGSEYFRIWIVNLLLTIVTLSLYYPWAKVRKLRYFYGNTLVGGQPLDFHGDPKTMLRGYLLVAALLGLYSVAGKFSAVAGLIALVIVAAIWPALLKSSMQFRLANTSWRGLRFRFLGNVGDAYSALLPMFVPALVIVAALAAVGESGAAAGLVCGAGRDRLAGDAGCVAPAGCGGSSRSTSTTTTPRPVADRADARARLVLRRVPEDLGRFVPACWSAWWSGSCGAGIAGGCVRRRPVTIRCSRRLLGARGVLSSRRAVAMQLVPRPYFTSRMQNLVWSRTGNEHALRQRAALLAAVRPDAEELAAGGADAGPVLALRRGGHAAHARRGGVGHDAVDPDDLVDQARGTEGEAAGDAAGDLFGLDIGL